MREYKYLIIGGGMTAASAVEGIREVDADGTIGIISAENHPPYNRPPLSKKLWHGKPESIIWRKLPPDNLDLILGCRVVSLDPSNKQVQDEDGNTYAYQKLLLATGGTTRRLNFAPPETCYYRTVDDYHTIRGWMGQGAHFGIIGGGFIGSEIAAALASNGEKVSMVFPEASIGVHIYPADLSQYLNQYYQENGVALYTGFELQNIERQGERFILRSKEGQAIVADRLIAGIGIRPNIELAEAAGAAIADRSVGGGILVDKYLRTNLNDVFAAGDVASFPHAILRKILRIEHADNANSMGRAAGSNMAGSETAYDHQPFFYSDLFDLGYEAVGELDSRLQIVPDWKEPFREGVIYYLKEDKVRGVLLWNTWDQVDAARKLIAEDKTYKSEALKGRLPEK